MHKCKLYWFQYGAVSLLKYLYFIQYSLKMRGLVEPLPGQQIPEVRSAGYTVIWLWQTLDCWLCVLMFSFFLSQSPLSAGRDWLHFLFQDSYERTWCPGAFRSSMAGWEQHHWVSTPSHPFRPLLTVNTTWTPPSTPASCQWCSLTESEVVEYCPAETGICCYGPVQL